MANSIKVDGKTITYVTKAVTENTVTFSDGTVLTMIGSVANTAVLKAYKAAKDAQVPPATTPPVIITKPSPGEPTLIGNKEFAVLSDVDTEKFALKPGIYADRSDLKNLKDVFIEGYGKVQFQTGQRAIQMNGGNFSGVTLSGLSFKNINDDVISVWGTGNTEYNPNDSKSFIDGITLQNIVAENCGTLFHMDGGIDKGKDYGVIKNFKFVNSSFINSANPGMVIYLGNGIAYDIYGNKINNINYQYPDPAWPNGYHNGILMLNGNGKVHDNIVTNHQGNAVRAWLHTQEGETKTVEIFNNIVWNSRKYSAFEVQVTPQMQAAGFLPANASVHDNIFGKLNNSKDWEGQGLDVYNFWGSLSWFNNTGFELNRDNGVATTDMLNNMADSKLTPIIRYDGNKYYTTQALAMASVASLKSALTGIIS